MGLLAFLLGGGKGTNRINWVRFYAKGKDEGFSLREIELLRKIAVKAEMEDPTALFWSVKQLDECIKNIIRKSRVTGDEHSLETQDFLAKLYEYRKKIEFDQPRYRKGLKNSRGISEHQRLRILVDGTGVFESRVVRNSDRYLSIQKPLSAHIPRDFPWKGKRLAAYFWRRDDAGYVFDTVVLDESASGGSSLLHLSHSDSLFRAQKRRSVRAKMRTPAFLYLPNDDSYPEMVESGPGMRCILEDLSEDGCAITVGGKAAAGMKVKVQFMIGGDAIAFSGIVKSVNYDGEANRSLLHVEAVPLSIPTRNRILSEVFGVNPDAELEAVFPVVGEEGHPTSVDEALANASAAAEPVLPESEA